MDEIIKTESELFKIIEAQDKLNQQLRTLEEAKRRKYADLQKLREKTEETEKDK